MSPRWSVLLLLLTCAQAEANPLRNLPVLRRTSRQLAGQVLDFTHNHGEDNRLWSPSLCAKRDMYVYLPPCYDPKKSYPLVLWLHGIGEDEVSFLKEVIVPLDQAISCGKLPPLIIAAPDGSIHGLACYFTIGSFFVNSKAGAFEDYLMCDVWNFMHENYPIRPERDAHIIAGVSMGGGAAYAKAFKYRERFGIIIGIAPPLNTRWESDRGRYSDDFDPDHWSFRTDFSRGREVVARFTGIPVRVRQITRPLYGRDPDYLEVAADNPLELMVGRDIKPGEFSMYIAYGGRDQFNVDAQVESFLYVARQRGIHPHVDYSPEGRHDRETALSFLPSLLDWLEPQLARFKIEP
jgi:pimeloyl-ACP methyl ester carboxylesterase